MMTYADYERKYGLPAGSAVQAFKDWLNNEGYDDNGEMYTLIQWLDTFLARITRPKNVTKHEDKTPYQKGDDCDF